MSQKKINPSSADLRKSILDTIGQTMGSEVPREEDFDNTEWVTVKRMAQHQNITEDAASKRLKRAFKKGELEMKTIRCICGSANTNLNLYKIPDEITRAY